MPNKKKSSRTVAIVLAALVGLTVANVVLKLTGVFSFSWWFVFLPMWGAPLMAIFVLGLFTLCWGFVMSNASKPRRR